MASAVASLLTTNERPQNVNSSYFLRLGRKTKKLTLFYQIILRFKLEALYSLVLITHFASDLRSDDFNP